MYNYRNDSAAAVGFVSMLNVELIEGLERDTNTVLVKMNELEEFYQYYMEHYGSKTKDYIFFLFGGEPYIFQFIRLNKYK